jgi:hypothetical protein
MKIEIDIDIESIVIEALKKKQEVPKVKTEDTQTTTTGRYYTAKEKATAWEFGPRSGHRRTAEERAMHVLERKHGRVLTPEEKGEARALIQIDETAENKAKEDTIKKIRIDGITAEGMAAASKELEAENLVHSVDGLDAPKKEAEEEHDNITRIQEGMDKHDVDGEVAGLNSLIVKEEPEATIPKTEKLDTDSLFL